MQSYSRNNFCIVFRFKYNRRRARGGKVRSRIMEDLIKEIYDNKMEKSKWNRTDYEIEKEIRDLLQHEEEHLPPQEYEKRRDKMYQAAFAGKEKGFAEGFRYGVRLTAECFIQKEDRGES